VKDLIAEPDRLAGQRGTYPTVLRCDNGPELACTAMTDWAGGQVGLHFIPPGAPWRTDTDSLYVEITASVSASMPASLSASGWANR
jgi:hypothetical protein